MTQPELILTDQERAIFARIKYAAENSETTPTLGTLACAAHCGRDKAGQVVRSLADKGVIRIAGDGPSYRVYHITGSFLSTVRKEVPTGEPPGTRAVDLDTANRRYLAALYGYLANRYGPHWKRNLRAIGGVV